MSRRLDDPRHTAWLVVGLSLSVLALSAVIYGRLPTTATGGAAVVDPSGGPCHPERWALACSRWAAQGWDCTLSPDGVPVAELTPALASLAPSEHLRGAVAELEGVRTVLIREDSCADTDPTAEHEVGHLLDLDDGGPTGGVMASPHERAGLRIPGRVP